MRLLGIETATASQSVALMQDCHVLAEASSAAEGSRGGRLLPMVDDVFKKADVALDALDTVAVSCGPGSFTGVRVGIATAQGLALATGARLAGISTLESLVRGYGKQRGSVCGLLDAGRNELYMCVFEWRGDRLIRVVPDALSTPERVAATVTNVTTGVVHIIGDGALRYRDRLRSALGDRGGFSEAGLNATPQATAVCLIALELAHQDAIVPPGPVYLRRAEAEINWEKGLVRSPLERLARTGKSK